MKTLPQLRKPKLSVHAIRWSLPKWGETQIVRHLGLAIIAYLAAILVLRLFHYSSLEHDEAEELFRAQTLSWGYSPQPPLYAWLVWGMSQLFGPGVLALTMLKAALLGAMYFMMDRIARRAIPDRLSARLATASLLLIPLFVWEMPRMAVSLLMVLATLGCLDAIQQIREARSTRNFLRLGLWLAVGALAKHSFLLFAVSLFLGVLCVPTLRASILNWRLGLSLLLALVLVLPHLLWVMEHLGEITTKISDRSGMLGSELSLISGVLNLGLTILVSTATVLVLAVNCFRSAWRWSHGSETGRLVVWFLLFSTLAWLGLIVFGGMRSFRVYWIAPMVLVFPLAIFAFLDRKPIPLLRLQLYAGAALASVLAVVGMIFATICYDAEGGKYQTRDFLYAELAKQVQELDFRRGCIITSDEAIAGHQRLYFPDSAVHSMTHPSVPVRESFDRGPWLIVWNATHSMKIPPKLSEFLETRFQLRFTPDTVPCRVEVDPRTFGSSMKRLGYLLVMPERESLKTE